jgi:hypothetical protein
LSGGLGLHVQWALRETAEFRGDGEDRGRVAGRVGGANAAQMVGKARAVPILLAAQWWAVPTLLAAQWWAVPTLHEPRAITRRKCRQRKNLQMTRSSLACDGQAACLIDRRPSAHTISGSGGSRRVVGGNIPEIVILSARRPHGGLT